MNKQEEVMMELRDVFNKMAWLNKIRMEASLKGHKPSEVHCIEYIGRHADSNVTKLAESFYMTRSAISKMTKKLMEKGLIESYQKADNKKEIYFRLTERGKAVDRVHGELHKEFHERDKAVFELITEEQYDRLIGFLGLYGKHLDAEITKLGANAGSETESE